MKPQLLVGVGAAVALAFAAGLALGPGGGAGRPSGPGAGSAPATPGPGPVAPAPAGTTPRPLPLPGEPVSPTPAPPGTAAPAKGTSSPAAATTTAGPPSPPAELPPYRPPSLGAGREGEGELLGFHEPFKNEQERQAWEEARRKRWEERLRAENDAAVELLQRKIGISPVQATEVKKTLDEALVARTDLIAKLRAGQVPRLEMQERVLAIKTKTETALRAILTPAQFDAYQKLDPRDKVLEDEAKGPK